MNQALSAPHRRSCLRGVSCHWSRPTTGPRAHPRWVSGGLGPAGWAGAHSFIWTIAWSHLDVEEVFEIFRRRQLNAKLSVSGHRPGTAVRARGGAAAQPPPGARSHSLPAALAGTQARRRRVAAPGGAAPLAATRWRSAMPRAPVAVRVSGTHHRHPPPRRLRRRPPPLNRLSPPLRLRHLLPPRRWWSLRPASGCRLALLGRTVLYYCQWPGDSWFLGMMVRCSRTQGFSHVVW